MPDDGRAIRSALAEKAREQVVLVARRLAMLYHYTAEVLAEEYGEEESERVLHEIIRRYGCESGALAREFLASVCQEGEQRF